MKVVFLDVDGVMNNFEDSRRIMDEAKDRPELWDMTDDPTPKAIALLKGICEKTGAYVVLSSSWRCCLPNLQKMIDVFLDNGIPFAGVTSEGVRLSKVEKYGIKIPDHRRPRWRQNKLSDYDYLVEERGIEIVAFLKTHPKITSFVAIDDEADDIEPYIPDNFVKTNPFVGLTEDDAAKAVDILTREEKSQ